MRRRARLTFHFVEGEPPAPLPATLEILRRNVPLLAVVSSIGIGGWLTALFGPASAAPLGALAAFWGSVIAPVVLWRNPWPRFERATFRAGDDGLTLTAPSGELRIARAEIGQAYVEPQGSFDIAHLEVRGRRLALRMHARQADAMLTALGVDAAHRAVAISGRSPVAMHHVGPIPTRWVLLALLLLVMPVFAPLLVILLVPVLLFLWAWPSRIVIGADGVHTSWLGRRRFVPFREVTGMEPSMSALLLSNADVALMLRGGGRVELAARRRYDSDAQQGGDDRALVRRLEEALRAHELHKAEGDLRGLLARGGRTVREWVRQVRATRDAQGAGYRGVSIPEEQLVAIVQDPSAEASLRAGAALALRAGRGDACRQALVEAAKACAEPRLRVALRVVAESEGEEVEGALEEIGEKRKA